MEKKYINGEKVNIRKLLSNVPLSNGLDLSRMRITRIRAIRPDALYDIFGKIYESFQGTVLPRLEGKGITFDGSFSYSNPEKTFGHHYTAPLGMLIDPLYLGLDRTRNMEFPHYVRFNTERCTDISPARSYDGLDKLMDAYVSSLDPAFNKKMFVPQLREVEAKLKHKN